MESSEHVDLSKQDSPEVLPPLIITANEVAGFDNVEEHKNLDNQYQNTGFHSFSPSAADERARRGKPEWLECFLQRTFSGSCEIHEPLKNELKNYCINCNVSA